MKIGEPIIKIDKLTVVYDLGKTSETKAVDDVSLKIFPQEYVIFFGPSGCGKSTVLYTMAGLEFPNSGKVFVLDQNVADLPHEKMVAFHRDTIGMVFQMFYLIPSLSVMDNVSLPAVFEGREEGERLKKARELLTRFGIESFAQRVALELSGGQQQRVAICRALMNDPPIILADEPVGNLDSKSAQMVMTLLTELNQEYKKTVILVTHDPSYLGYAHRVFHMKDGKITHIVTNKQQRRDLSPDEKNFSSELERLARIFPFSPVSRLKAKAILNALISHYDIEELEKLEEVIENFITKKMTFEDFQDILDKPLYEGGVGLYKEKAKDFSHKVASFLTEKEIVLKMLKKSDKKGEAAPSKLNQVVDEIRKKLLDEWEGRIKNTLQLDRLNKGIMKRALGAYDKRVLETFFQTPLRDGGAGFNRRTAKNFARGLELILIQLEGNE